MAYTEDILSASTDGLGILIVGTDTGSADTIHTAVTGTDDLDKITLQASNNHTADVELTIEYGEDTATKTIVKTIKKKSGLRVMLAGLPLQNAKVVKAFASVANKVTIFGGIERITA